jgi:hypothetical protein
MTVLVADMRVHIRRLVSVVKMVTVLEECTTEGQHYVLGFLWGKGPDAKDTHEEIFPVYNGKSLLHKAVHNWFKQFS